MLRSRVQINTDRSSTNVCSWDCFIKDPINSGKILYSSIIYCFYSIFTAVKLKNTDRNNTSLTNVGRSGPAKRRSQPNAGNCSRFYFLVLYSFELIVWEKNIYIHLICRLVVKNCIWKLMLLKCILGFCIQWNVHVKARFYQIIQLLSKRA